MIGDIYVIIEKINYNLVCKQSPSTIAYNHTRNERTKEEISLIENNSFDTFNFQLRYF